MSEVDLYWRDPDAQWKHLCELLEFRFIDEYTRNEWWAEYKAGRAIRANIEAERLRIEFAKDYQSGLMRKYVGAADRHGSFNLSFKDDGGGDFTAYVAVFGNRDRANEVIDPGAFVNLDEFAADGVGLVGHDTASLPVAWIKSASQDRNGLKVVGKFHSTPAAQAVKTVVLERMEAGRGVKCSIGYRVLESGPGADGSLHLKRVAVYEFSFVNIPCNPMAGVLTA